MLVKYRIVLALDIADWSIVRAAKERKENVESVFEKLLWG